HSRFRDFRPAMITARSGNDFNYMLLDDTRVETSRFETGGYREQPGGLMAFLYGDREIYRPGETIHSHVIVRNRAWKAQSGMPVKFKLILPNGRELSTQRKTLNAQGAASQDFALAPGTVTGSYTLELYSANDVLLHSKSISVEEFMPDRISVKASTSKDNYLPGDSIQVSGEAANLFGTAAAARKYEVQFSLSKSLFQPKGYEAYNFSIMGLDQVSLPSVFREGKTGENGRFRESMYLDPVYRETGMLQGKAFVTVFDETGRPVNRVAPFEVETQQVFFGTRTSEYYAGVGQALQMGIVSLNSKGQAVPVTARVRLLKINYHNVLKRNYSDRLYFVSQKEERIIQDRVVSTGGRELQLPFTPTESGEYVLRVSLPGSERYVQQSFYAYGRGFTGSNAFAVNTEGTIDITADREVYHPGENAKLLFKTPFNGKLLVTVEQNEVIRHYFLVTDKKTAELVLPVEREYLPNVYITATIFRKLEDSFVPLTVAHGVVPLLVESGQNRIPLSITAAARSRANTRQQITVKTTPGKEVELTIAVVDEGILQLRNSKSPDPYAFFYQKKALMVDGYDLYPFLLPELKLRRSSSGGDGYDLAKRVNPITSKRVKLV
ncbi:MAG: alpha-2-macroglobulin family protein, partial [Bacteroidia bacterium]|nr:alpha-2-macroglobulin family protein [Bacteroidia bacterium]